MRRHPSGKTASSMGKTYTVRRGDTLWSIAALVLRTDNPRAIARYWPKMHRANRQTIGADPNTILPGQLLLLPNDHEVR